MRTRSKLKKVIETAQIDWNRLTRYNVPDREILYLTLKDRLTSAQIDELYNAIPICITSNRFCQIDDFFDYVYYAINLFKEGVVDIDIEYGETYYMN
jgi:hypothetical protein